MNPREITMGMAALANLLAESLSKEELDELLLAMRLLKDNLEGILLERILSERRDKAARDALLLAAIEDD